jgi:hypothetical protein
MNCQRGNEIHRAVWIGKHGVIVLAVRDLKTLFAQFPTAWSLHAPLPYREAFIAALPYHGAFIAALPYRGAFMAALPTENNNILA